MNSIRINKKEGINNFKISLLVLLGIVIVVMISVLIFRYEEYRENRVAVKINGETVSVNEFRVNLLNHSANTYSYFKQKYGVDDSAEFWTANYGGEIPIEYARKKALEDITRVKIEQILAKQKGLVKNISYSSFLKQLEEENKARKEAVAKKQVIYGPVVYGKIELFNYLHSNLLIKLKDSLGENEFKLSEDELRKLYETAKDKSYKNPDQIKVFYIKASSVDENGVLNKARKADAKAKIEQLKTLIDKGEAFESVARTQEVQRNVETVSGDRIFNSESWCSDNEDIPKLLETANVLESEQISGIVEENDSFYILKCTERKDMGYIAFPEAKDTVKSNYMDEKFDEMVAKLIKDAKIEIVESVYKKIMVR